MWMPFLFWLSLGVIFFTYIGYPVLLYLFTFLKNSNVKVQPGALSSATVIIAAFNEERVIAEKIKNTFNQAYPKQLMQIIIVADGSTDATAALASAFKEVLVLFNPQRKGKSAAVNRAVQFATNDLLIFTDANSFLQPGAFYELLQPFLNPDVGAVAGEKKVIHAYNHQQGGEGLYWKYESWVKQQETKFYSVIGAAGELFAIRKKLFTAIPEEIIADDFFLSLSVNLQHKKVAYAKKAVSMEHASLTLMDEWKRKVRIASGGIQALFVFTEAFNFFKHPGLAFQFVSHRVFRWLFCSPAFILLFFSNLFLMQHTNEFIYTGIFWLQVLFYVFALAGWFMILNKKYFPVFVIPFYILFMHAAMLAGLLRYFKGKQTVLWEKAQR